jgi:hypothetical protein
LLLLGENHAAPPIHLLELKFSGGQCKAASIGKRIYKYLADVSKKLEIIIEM